MNRRSAMLMGLNLTVWLNTDAAQAIGFQKELKKRKIPIEEYSTLDNGLKYYDLSLGIGAEVARGDRVTVHFDCYFRNIDAVSSRYATVLGKNEVIPEPYEFTAGRPVNERKAKKTDREVAGGSFSGMSGPKPPPALSTSVFGMKKGGKRSIIVTPEQGYGDEGMLEIPPGTQFELQVEILDISKA